MRKFSKVLLLGAAFLAATTLSASSSVTLPAWMQKALSEPKGTYSDETKAVVLLDEQEITVTGVGDYIEHGRRVVRILRPAGRSFGHYAVEIRNGEKILDLHAWSVDPTGHNFEVKQKDFLQVSNSDVELYDDSRNLVPDISGVDVGSVVAFEYELKRHDYVPELHWYPQESVPVKSTSFSVELPQGWEYSAAWANVSGKQPESVTANRWRWALNDLPGIEEEPYRPELRALVERLEVAYFAPGTRAVSGSWGAVGSWYKSLVDPRRTSNPELVATVRRLTTDRTGFDAQVRAIADFVQGEIRYVAIAIGIGGQQPHAANDVFRHRYGDCKDKATLMATMLNELGYHSELVLVDTDRGFMKDTVPSSVSNHAILAVELPAGIADNVYPAMVKTKSGKRYVIFDPTNQQLPFGLIPSYEQNSWVVIASDPGELVKLPLLDPSTSTSDNVGKFTLAADGTLAGGMLHRYAGNLASRMRRALLEYDGNNRSKLLEIVASSSLKQASLEQPEFENLKANDKDLLLKYQVKMSGYAQTAGGMLLVRPRVFGDRGLHLPSKKRKYAIELSGTRHEHDDYEIAIPAGYVVDELPDPVKVDVGFASYESKVESKGNVIHYTRDYVVRDPYIDVSKLSELNKLENQIGADEFATAVLKKAP